MATQASFERTGRASRSTAAASSLRFWHAPRSLRAGAQLAFEYAHRCPATLFLLAIITWTTLVQMTSGAEAARSLVLANSSSVGHLRHFELDVLVTSAFWLDSQDLLGVWAVLFFAVLAPAERWLGTARWLVVFVCGHIGATVITVAGIWIATAAGAASSGLEHASDVGVSYGFVAVAAVLACRLPPRWRVAAVASLLGALGLAWLADGTFTDAGHVAAATIGVAVYCVLLRRTKAAVRLPASDSAAATPT